MVSGGVSSPVRCSERVSMPVQNQPSRHLRSRPAFRLHSRRDLTALTIVRHSTPPRQGITVQQRSSGPSVSFIHHEQGRQYYES